MTTVLQQQLKANTSQRETMDRVNLLVKLMMLKPQMLKEAPILLDAEEWIIQMEKLLYYVMPSRGQGTIGDPHIRRRGQTFVESGQEGADYGRILDLVGSFH